MRRDNAYDVLRIFLSVFVIVSHCSYLKNVHSPDIYYFSHRQTYLAEIGVIGFFALSGYLITKSYQNKKDVLQFLLNRILRIFPAFWLCLIVTAYIIAPGIYKHEYKSLCGFPFTGYYSSYNYVRTNSLIQIRQAKIGGTLDHFEIQTLNGSLWSLFIELQCYLLTMCLGLIGFLKRKMLLAGFFIFAWLSFAIIYFDLPLSSIFKTFLDYSNAKLFCAYLGGAVYYVYEDKLVSYRKGMIPLFLVVLLLSLRLGGANFLLPLLLPVILLGAFSTLKWEMKNDISYGLYIYSFPIQYLLFVYYPHLDISPYLLLSISIAAVIAYLSFVVVEKPALRIKYPLHRLLILPVQYMKFKGGPLP